MLKKYWGQKWESWLGVKLNGRVFVKGRRERGREGRNLSSKYT
jgi:hypothetical protein